MSEFRHYLSEIKKFDKLNNFLMQTQTPILFEAIIYPEKIRTNGMTVDELNAKFKDLQIYFETSNELRGAFNPKTGNINVFVPKNYENSELEAMIGHELIHREQNKKSDNLFSKKTEKLVHEINTLILDYSENKTSEKLGIIQKKMDYFNFGTSQEKMAYAYQLTKDTTFGFKSPSDIIRHLEMIPGFKIDNQFKKYIGMYWLIKDKI